ncbi:succinate--CoA ligase subunit alpha [Caulobacter sp. S45]|jgi:succinyl-CoA synthetase alpha subunit|uniref:succinate--CoA ligase subunit alpha n=1 Tax=Caulobacter sp. S45 TaxID=1641861 RepID=UPI00131A90AB|nr:succinate--CoA ligase subunit alpha [Caulobacter sp. S45]
MTTFTLDPATKVIVQGATGRMGRRHTELMLGYGTRIVGGIAGSGRREGSPTPLFDSCAEAVAATGAETSITLVPPMDVLAAVTEALEGGIRLIVSPSEGMPVHDAVVAYGRVQAYGATWVGPSTPGLAIPGKMKLGFIPDISLAPGPLGIMSKSGTLSYEACFRLASAGMGQSTWVGVGGDPVKGVRFAELLPYFQADPATRAVVVLGEIGGGEEEELAEEMARLSFGKPVFVLLAGSSAPEGVTMGHAGALIQGGRGTIQSKTTALRDVGAQVFTSIEGLVRGVMEGDVRS